MSAEAHRGIVSGQDVNIYCRGSPRGGPVMQYKGYLNLNLEEEYRISISITFVTYLNSNFSLNFKRFTTGAIFVVIKGLKKVKTEVITS